MIEVGAQPLRVAVKRGPKGRPPFLLFNGIGANLELAKPFLRALKRTEAHHLRRARRWRIPAPPYALSALVNCASGRAAFDETWDISAPISAACRGAAGLRSSSPISTTTCAESSCWRRRRRGRSWCPAVRGCCGRWRRRGGMSTRASCGASPRRFTAAPSAKTRSSSKPTPRPWLERAAADTSTRSWR